MLRKLNPFLFALFVLTLFIFMISSSYTVTKASNLADNDSTLQSDVSQPETAQFQLDALTLKQPGATKFLSGPNHGYPLDIALAFIHANRQALNLSEADLADVIVTDMYQTKDTGVTHIYLRQRYNGLEIYGADLNINIAADGSVINLGSRFASNLAQGINSHAPALSAIEATEAAAQQLGLNITEPLAVEQTFTGSDQAILLSDGGISLNAIPARLMYQPTDGEANLVWDITIYQLDALHWWSVRVDATTGELLHQDDWVDHETQNPPEAAQIGSYRVYTYPAESPNHVMPLPPADGRMLHADPDNATASPFGWHDTNGVAGAEFTTTQGNNAHAYTDTDANNSPDPGSSPDGTAALIFDFPIDLTLPPSAYRPAAVTNLFYWNNLIHDVSYLHGFDEAAGNFQENNYGNGGLGSDYVYAEAQDGSGTNNANFATPPDGQNPRMQMYIFTLSNPNKDGDLDNGIILHEYGHGISNRMTGGPSNVSCLGNAEQMGEGWSDWQSVIHTMEVGDQGTDVRGMGTYVLNQPTNGNGVRPAPYTTDMGINPYTYGNLPSMAIPHGVGFVWATMLWEMNWGLIDAHGFNPSIYGDWTTGGNNLAYRLVQDGMKLQPCSPGFIDGRDAILQADLVLTGGANECIIWEAFAKRGLGYSASQGSSSSTGDGTEAFDLPPICGTPIIEVNPDSLSSSQYPDVQVMQTLTINNTGDGDLEWDIFEDGTSSFGGSWSDNFDSYATGSQMHGQGGWKGWDNSPAAGALTSDVQALSAPNSVDIMNVSDLVQEYSGYNSGVWIYTAWQYIPSNYSGDQMFILLNTYSDGGAKNWSTQVRFQSASNQVLSDFDGATLPLITGQWVELRVEIDLDADVQTFYYDGQMLYQKSWVDGVSGGGAANIAAVDLWGNGGTSVYYDNMSLARPAATCDGPDPIDWVSVSPISGTIAAMSSTDVDVTFDSTGYAAGVYTGTLCVNSNDPLNPVVSVPLTMTVLQNSVPVAVADAYTTTQNTAVSISAPGVLTNDSDGDGHSLTAVLDSDVSSGTLSLDPDGSFTYTPTAGFEGDDMFTYYAHDGLDDSNVVTVTIAVLNTAPVAVSDSYTTTQDTMLSVAAPGVLLNDSDVDGDGLTAVLDSDVMSGTLTLNADGSFDYMPDAGFVGEDSFTYHAHDGTEASNSVTVTITVTAGGYTIYLPFVSNN